MSDHPNWQKPDAIGILMPDNRRVVLVSPLLLSAGWMVRFESPGTGEQSKFPALADQLAMPCDHTPTPDGSQCRIHYSHIGRQANFCDAVLHQEEDPWDNRRLGASAEHARAVPAEDVVIIHDQLIVLRKPAVPEVREEETISAALQRIFQ